MERHESELLQKHWSGWKRWVARLWGIVEGKGYAPLELCLSFIFHGALRKALQWNPTRVIMAHGQWQKNGGKTYLEKAFTWIG